MAGVKKLRRIQLGLETTAGTAVAATALWRGLGTIEDQLETVFPEEDIGYLSGVDRTYIPKVLAALSMDDTPATFEQLPYLLSAGVQDTVSGSADGSGSGKIYSYVMPTTAAQTLKTYTLEGGDNQQAEEFAYAFVESFKLSGKGGEALMMSAEWKGRQVSPTTFTTSPALPAVEEILFSKGLLYIDTAGGTIGTTTKSNTLLGIELSVTTGIVPVFSADGELYFSFTKTIEPEAMLSITFEHETTSVAEKVAWRAGTARQIRLKWQGSALATAGTAYTYKTLIVDLAGKWEKFDKLDEQDGNDIVTGTFRARYNSTAALFAEFLVVNELASLP
jgi:hypothetical protein